MARYYQDIHREWVLENHEKYHSYEKITEDFNAVFGARKSVAAVMQYMNKQLGVFLETAKTAERYTEEQKQWLTRNFEKVNTYKELTEKFNDRFHRDKPLESIRDLCCKRLGLSGMDNPTVFRKGHIKEQCPIGTIREVQGMKYVKVKDCLYSYMSGYQEPWWLPVPKKIWQDHFGPVPEGKMVICLDGNKENPDIENLYCIDRRISIVMAKNRWYTDNRENTLAAIKWCELHYALKESVSG